MRSINLILYRIIVTILSLFLMNRTAKSIKTERLFLSKKIMISSRLRFSSKSEQFIKSVTADKDKSNIILANEIIEKYLLKSSNPSIQDIQVIEQRQLCHKVSGLFAVEAVKCRHGYTRAYVQYPIGGGMSSGMLRLSCPHLVKEIDNYEYNNKGIEKVNKLLSDDINDSTNNNNEMKKDFSNTNKIWKEIRNSAVSKEDKLLIEERLGVDAANNLLESGIIGITTTKTDDCKCVHAHVADYLLRGENKIGEFALNDLKNNYNVDPTGCDNCWQQCNPNTQVTTTTWWYMSKKNKQKLHTKKLNRYLYKQANLDKLKKNNE